MTTALGITKETTLQNSIEDLDIRWDAVLSRDTSFDGLFVYAVATTGVYYMPSCPSRKPLRKNMSLFAMPELAEAAGFRPCLRCQTDVHPSEDAGLSTVREVSRIIAQEPKRSTRVPTICRRYLPRWWEYRLNTTLMPIVLLA